MGLATYTFYTFTFSLAFVTGVCIRDFFTFNTNKKLYVCVKEHYGGDKTLIPKELADQFHTELRYKFRTPEK